MRKNRKRGLCAACVAILCLTATGCQGTGDTRGDSHVKSAALAEYPADKTYNTEEEYWDDKGSRSMPEQFYAAYEDFSYETASAVLRDGDANIMYSPLGLYFTLALAAEGAGGETRRELLSLLNYSDAENLSADCKDAYEFLYHGPVTIKKGEDSDFNPDTKYQLKIFNSLWADRSVKLKKKFADQAARYFYSDLFSVDFKDPETPEYMADWVEERTNGLIRPQMDLSGDSALSMMNTIYFYDEWMDRFSKEQTKEGIFTKSGGETVTCDFMNRTMGSHGFWRGENYTASFLNLKNGMMEFYLPDQGTDVHELLKTPEILEATLNKSGGTIMGEVVWQVPKFSHGSKIALKDVLMSLGVTKAFGDADFTNITDDPLFISNVRQETRVGIDENGVEAAAFTEIMYAGAALPDGRAEMILDRPFLYVIRNRGTILFIGICEDPSL